MLIVFRTDASSAIGTGHVIRCLGLAREMRRRGHSCLFVCRALPHNLISFIESHEFRCVVLSERTADQRDEALQTIELARAAFGCRPELFIVDHYQLDYHLDEVFRSVAPVAVIDDLADRRHDCDVLVDVTHTSEEAFLYDALVPQDCIRLIGQRYLLLRDEFREIERHARPKAGVSTILVTLGGNDPADFTSKVLDALEDPALRHLRVEVTAGFSNPRVEKLKARIASLDRVSLHIQHPRPSELMRRADICIGAGGMTVWECCYLGLPTLLVMLAENQRRTCAIVSRVGAARLMGPAQELSRNSLTRHIIEAITDDSWRSLASARGQELVDGLGLQRVADSLEACLNEKAQTRVQ